MMHGAERVHVMRQLRHLDVRKFGGAAGGDVLGGVGDAQQRPGERAREKPGDETCRHHHEEAGGRDGPLDGVDLGVHHNQRRGDARDRNPRRSVPDRDVELAFIGGRAQALVHSDSAR